MMKNFTLWFLCILLLCNTAKAQPCSPLVITGSTVSSASCPAGGGITVTATGTNVTYQIISGPSGYPAASNTTGIFGSLVTGTYIVEAKDDCNVTATVTKVVTNTYVTFSVSAGSTSNVCTSGAQGGTISGTVTGGKAPYQYDIVPVADLPSYGANTASTTYSKAVTSFGTYRIYAKDACGEVRTYDIELLPTQPKPIDFWWEDIVPNRPCGEIMDGLPTITLNVHLIDQNSIAIDMHNLIGSTYQVYKPSPANSITTSSANSGCTATQGALLTSGTILLANIPSGDNTAYPITIPQEDIIFVITTKCGETFKYCYNFNQGNPYTPDAIVDLVQQSCNAVWNNQIAYIKPRYVFNMTEPITYLLTKNGGATVTNNDGYFYGLTMANLPATVKLTDACGKVVTKTIPKPVQGSALQSEQEPQWQFYCSNVQNTASALIRITGGDLPGLADATNVIITGGTVTAVPGISAFQDWIPGYIASNLLAGYTYKIVITNTCNEKDSLLFTVPLDHWGQPILNWNLTATTNALCGQNKGTITAISNFSGNETVNYFLYNLLSPNTVIATNTTGIFQDVVQGNYKVKFTVPSSSTDCPNKLITDSITVAMLSTGAAQSIVRKTITTCEDVNGNQLTTGKAIVQVNGSAPFTYEIIKSSLIGTGATEIWTVSSVNNPSNTYQWDLPLASDPPFTLYTYRSVDNCGNKVTTQGSLQPLGQPLLQTGFSPCLGQVNYTVSISPYAGNFTYRWVKLPDLATTLSTQNTLTFADPYTAVNNGTYRCYVSLAGCLNRTKDVVLNSNLCGFVLPIKLLSFTGSYNNQTALLKWTLENETNISNYELERSDDGVTFKKINTIAVKGSTTSFVDYTQADNLVSFNNTKVYYRLKIVDQNGKYTYSPIVRLNLSNSNETISLYPNPTKGDIAISFTSNNKIDGVLKITDVSGKMVVFEKIQIQKGSNNVSLPQITTLSSGSYYIQIISSNLNIASKFVKL
ncbi:MAG: T9SS type A sorting domain-containing protein [Chitinophagaceae bacterium]|nr:T9SS type A sorting domain-containing protein [Chitinophagaceae bacterium]